MVQDPIRMGYEGVLTVAAQLEGKPVEKRLDTGVVMITPENLKKRNRRLLNPPIDTYSGNDLRSFTQASSSEDACSPRS